MAKAMKKDNSTLSSKVSLRQGVLREIESPVILETHGGYGQLWARCYSHIENGVAIERDHDKAASLARNRPTWAVYQADCVVALASGVGSHLPINFVDLDPWGEPWHAITAFFESDRPWPKRLALVVTDGLRQKLRIAAWDVASMADMVPKYGNRLGDVYLEVCQELLTEKAAHRGYALRQWAGYYCGHADQMTHYAAVLER